MNKSALFLIVVIIGITSCTGIPKEKLTVIENIKLGGPSNAYRKQFDSLQIQNKRFITKTLLMKYDDLSDDNNYYYAYYTDLFNFNEFQNPKESLEHLGLLIPITLRGTSNNFALLVLLCRTKDPWLAGELERFKNTVEEKFIRQEVNNEIIYKIKSMYISKYGEPKSVDTSEYNSFYMIKGNSFSKEKANGIQAVTIKWETDYYDVTFFTGFDLNGIYNPEYGYRESTNGYRANISDDRANPSKNELNCGAYAFIYYELNDKAMKELKTDNKKL